MLPASLSARAVPARCALGGGQLEIPMRSLTPAFALLFAACTGADTGSTETGGTETGSGGEDTGFPDRTAVCSEATAIACEDAMVQELSLHDDKVNKGEVTTTTEGTDFVTLVDATSGGSSGATKNAWVYVHFSETGAEKLEIDDESALTDLGWHLALRRYVLRLNGGDGGPSCVGASPMPRKTYEELSVDDVEGAEFELEDFYSDTCKLDTDQIGTVLTTMSDWYDYQTCVATTDTPFLIQLEDGHVIKLVVESYYDGEGQAECNDGGSTDFDGGWLTLRWAYVY